MEVPPIPGPAPRGAQGPNNTLDVTPTISKLAENRLNTKLRNLEDRVADRLNKLERRVNTIVTRVAHNQASIEENFTAKAATKKCCCDGQCKKKNTPP